MAAVGAAAAVEAAVEVNGRDAILGLGWRPEVASFVLAHEGLDFVEVLIENLVGRPLPPALDAVRRRGLTVIPHGVSLSLGGAEWPDAKRLSRLARLAEVVDAPLVSEHVAFVRSGGLEAGHLLPVPRTRHALDVLVENVRIAQGELPVPLALENVAGLFEWPESEFDEADFLTELLERTEALLLLDVANLYANARNHGFDAAKTLDRIPLERLAYVHIAGGIERGGVYVDTHAHTIPRAILSLLSELTDRCPCPPVMLERDDNYPPAADLQAELDAIEEAQQ